MNESITTSGTVLTTLQFHQLADVPPAIAWFANLDNPQTRRAYEADLREFMAFTGVAAPAQLRDVTRGHVLAWRRDLERRALAGSTIRRKLAALSSLFDSLCEAQAVVGNPVDGVRRPRATTTEGVTPALGDDQARALLEAGDPSTLAGLRDRAILATLLYHGLRRAELCALRVADLQRRRGVDNLQVHGKGDKLRYVPLHPEAAAAIAAYLRMAGHGGDRQGALFRPTSNNTRGRTQGITPDGVYRLLRRYLSVLNITDDNLGPHALRATAATNALENGADIAQVQAWLGHASIATTRVYDRRQMRRADSPTFSVNFAPAVNAARS
ncbi:tyrosine-type recombinase/integrase [Pseudoduganella umbonata]|uniref:Integrase n=1 Tax=Pseudoduganella umbonata TaxID=864828 RepID=A0A4P8HI21_9BURK|nr:tyrosine-type recombinase/integrase [Pseudoduganella umbonata]MBB3221600.1 site-specific recombinase XerD [Pseudoduganella umbonata]QCP09163.1 integrase [Pseudoduganella umbonata]